MKLTSLLNPRSWFGRTGSAPSEPARDRVGGGKRHAMRARYDAAQTTDENRRHWSAADGFDSDAANNLGVRMILRNRSRYVFANNPRARGMILTLATHTHWHRPAPADAPGVRAQARRLNDKIESCFRTWAKEIKLAKKLRIIRIAKVISGEIFPVLTYNPGLACDVKLDLQLIEADQVTNLVPAFPPRDVDGVFFDEFGNPDFYRVLKYHPGSLFRGLDPIAHEDISARYCLHYFGQDRPNQHRGIPEITPAVQLVEEGRRFRAAVLGAAETAADYSLTIESDAPANEEDADDPDPMDEFELQRRMATVLPKGWKMSQTKAEQPTTGFKEFTRELLAEVARCLQMPVSIATLDAVDANMSSSYVVNQPYEKAIDAERFDLASDILDPLLDMWLTMAFDPMRSEAPLAKRTPMEFPHSWFWPSIGNHADPAKVSSAQATRLANNLTTLEAEYAREGQDWEAALRQRAKEKELMKELGLSEPINFAQGPAANPAAGGTNNTSNEEEPDDGDSNANDPTSDER
jgi:capsid protein